jgi:hypothetical protein
MASSRTGISKIGTVIAALAGIAIAWGVGYGLHKAAKKRSEARAVVSVVGETTTQLRDALKTPSREALEKIEGNLRVARTWSNPEVADATEIYLLGAREIVRRRTEASRYAQKAAASRAALSAHMNRAGHRDSPWFRTAIDLKKQVERDHVDLDIQLKALADLLDTLPDAHKRLEPHVAASLLLEDGLRRQARGAVLEEAKRASAELDKTRSLLTPN